MKRLYSLLLVLVLALAVSGSALAQDGCGDLSADDCDAIYASLDSMNQLSSGSNYIEVSVVGSDLPGLGDLGFVFTYASDFSYNDEAMGFINSLEEMGMEEVTAMYSDAEGIMDLVGTILGNMQAVVSMSTSFSPETAALAGALAEVELPEEFVLNFAINEGIFLIDLGPLSPLLPEDLMGGMPLQGWIGVELMPLLANALAGAEVDAATAEMAGMTVSSPMGAGVLFAQLGMMDPNLTQFFSIESVDDGVYSTMVDYGAVLDSPVFDAVVWVVLSSLTGEEPSDEDWAAWSAWARGWAPAIVDATVLELLEALDEDAYLVETDFILDVDFGALAEAGAIEASEGSMLSVNIYTSNINLDAGVAVEIPQGLVLPAAMLEGMLGGE
jgi:hypothetical protein